MESQLTQSVEDYLKAIYELTIHEGRATTSKLAEYLEVTPASVTGMVKKLAAIQPPLVEYRKHRGVSLTDYGKKAALETLRHHRLLELFLFEILGYPWDRVHEEADRLEHVISEELEERIASVLGDPKHDPHGDPIPSKDLEVPPSPSICLSDLKDGDSAVILRVRDTDSNLLRYLMELGIVPNNRVEVMKRTPFDDNLHIRVLGNEETHVLGPDITDQIYVETN
jgi:DtxR family Mn-dependent transcriptional regulator